MNLNSSVNIMKGVGPQVEKKLHHLGISSLRDLLDHYPRRYDDYSVVTEISKLKPGAVTVTAKIKQIKGRYVRRGLHITEAVASDPTGSLKLVWFNQPYRAGATKLDQEYFISGNFEMSRGRLALMNPAMELVSNFPVNSARIVPIYKETKGLKSATLRKIISNLRSEIQQIPDNLPADIIKSAKIISKSKAIMAMHFPDSASELQAARKRLGFEEIFELALASEINKTQLAKEKTHVIEFNEEIISNFVAKLPFTLTDSQKKVAWQVFLDMQKDMPMNRMVEGDVGSGKTVVSVMAAIMAISKGFQVALMAPTELLAQQHADSVYSLLRLIGMENEVALLTGSVKTKARNTIYEQIKNGESKFIVGTHALIADKVDMHNLGLVIIDEQHRFGVNQRKKIQQKASGVMPHVLSMTATPIPRSLALTLYGELDISVISQKPKGRLPVVTEIVSPSTKLKMYEKIENEIAEGRQIYVVCPLIDESEKLNISSAEKVYKDLSEKVFKRHRVGLLHGKMKSEEKDAIMKKFVDHQLDILVSTTVIEVGVDVPNATVMVIEAAERFGLAQAHQLRGRIGRSDIQSYCYLVMSDSSEPSRRIKALESSNDGFKLSELDLEIRGPGAIYGHNQSGALDLRVAKLSDVHLIEQARIEARKFVETGQKLDEYPELLHKINKYRLITNLN